MINLLMYTMYDCLTKGKFMWLFFRFIGSAKISLRDLASGQVKSLPSKNVPLINEKQQAVGVITFS